MKRQALLLLLALALTTAPVYATETEVETEVETEAETELVFNVEYDLEYQGGVPKDTTGKWDWYATDKDVDPYDYAIDFCEAFCGNFNYVAAVINTYDNTTTCLSYSPDNGESVTVTVHEYVPGEEENAKTLFSGKTIKSRVFDIGTGFWFDYDTGESGYVETETEVETE